MPKSKDIVINSHHVDILRKDVEEQFGMSLHSPRDFTRLCYEIEDKLNESLSLSTIKRLWGYVECDFDYEPRLSTLSLLARYLGYADWLSYVDNLKDTKGIDSSFAIGKSIVVEDLNVGDEITFTWAPNRRCQALYLGGNCFKVLSSSNSKIEPNDTFHTTLIAVGHPMYATNVVKHTGEIHSFYVAGGKKGLASLTIRHADGHGPTPVK